MGKKTLGKKKHPVSKMPPRTKIRKGDLVEIIAGDEKGYRGVVQRVIRKKWRGRHAGLYNPNDVWVVVAGANLVTKHQRPTGSVRTQVGRIQREAPIHISNVMLVARGADKPTRVSYKITDSGERVRYSRKYDEFLDE